MLVQELILDDGRMTGWYVAGEVVLARADGFDGAIRKDDLCSSVAGNLYVPFHMLQGLLPSAGDGAVG